jgi:hypothetical protein
MSPGVQRSRGLLIWAGVLACSGGTATNTPGLNPPVSFEDAGASAGRSGSGGAASASGGTAGVASDAARLPVVDASTGSADVPAPAGLLGNIVVSAGDLDRQNTIVSFLFPAAAGRTGLALRDQQGQLLLLQVDQDGRATFVLPALRAGTQATYAVDQSADPPADAVTTGREGDGVKVALGPSPVLRYQMAGKLPAGIEPKYLRGGYLYPFFTPSGVLVTNDYPSDHHNAHGIWSAWAPVAFEGHEVNFWAMGEGTGKGDFEALVGTWNGPVHGGFRSRQVQVSLAVNPPKTALREQWTVTVYKTHDGAAPYFVFDLDSIQETATMSPVMVHPHIYGGFAFRGHAQWLHDFRALTSEGKTLADGDGSTARWCFIGGDVDGKPVGYAVLGHPGNFRAPQPLRINPQDPFFSFAPAKAGAFDLVAGKPYVSHFRIITADGPADAKLFERQWNDYAHPPQVVVQGAAP